MDDSLAVLDYYESLGMSEVWLTPHIMEDIPNTTDDLKKRFEELCKHYKGNAYDKNLYNFLSLCLIHSLTP